MIRLVAASAQSARSRLLIVTLVLGLVLGTVAVQRSFADTPGQKDPYADLTDEQRITAMSRVSAAENARAEEYIRAFFASGRDLRSLKRGALGLSGQAPRSLDQAAAEAVAIVTGTIRRVDYFDGPTLIGWNALVQVESSLKGSPGAALVLLQSGGPNNDGGAEQLLEDELTPLLLPGDRAVLLLVEQKSPAGYLVPRLYGQYRIVNDKVYAIEHNPDKQYDAMPLKEFLDVLGAKLAAAK